MAKPVKLIDILSEQSAVENIRCDECSGTGELLVAHEETGLDTLECNECLGTGYNQLGLIIQGVLRPPEEGYGPVELKEALGNYLDELKRQRVIQETQEAIAEAQAAITETQRMIAKAQQMIADKDQPEKLTLVRAQLKNNLKRAESELRRKLSG